MRCFESSLSLVGSLNLTLKFLKSCVRACNNKRDWIYNLRLVVYPANWQCCFALQRCWLIYIAWTWGGAHAVIDRDICAYKPISIQYTLESEQNMFLLSSWVQASWKPSLCKALRLHLVDDYIGDGCSATRRPTNLMHHEQLCSNLFLHQEWWMVSPETPNAASTL